MRVEIEDLRLTRSSEDFWKMRTGPPPCAGWRLRDRRPILGGSHGTAAQVGSGLVTEDQN
ncbi:hypothetical protein KI387_034746, partial [Taxus chinensis]